MGCGEMGETVETVLSPNARAQDKRFRKNVLRARSRTGSHGVLVWPAGGKAGFLRAGLGAIWRRDSELGNVQKWNSGVDVPRGTMTSLELVPEMFHVEQDLCAPQTLAKPSLRNPSDHRTIPFNLTEADQRKGPPCATHRIHSLPRPARSCATPHSIRPKSPRLATRGRVAHRRVRHCRYGLAFRLPQMRVGAPD